MESKHLLLVPKPFPDESINGYIQRIAYDNGYDNANWLYSLKGIYRSLKTSTSQEKDLAQLAKFLNVEYKCLYNLTFLDHFSENEMIIKYLFRQGITTHSKYCPKCFKDQGYHNKYWDLSFNFFCYKHHLLLIDFCPNCNKAISSNLQNMYTCLCGFPLHQLPLVKAPIEYSFIGKLIEDIFRGKLSSNESILTTLSPRDFSNLILFIIQQLYFEKYKKISKISTEFNKGEEYISIVNDAFQIFQSWPNRFYEFLYRFGKNKKRKDRITGVTTYFGRFYIQLYKEFNKPTFDFIRKEFENYLMNNFNKVYFNRINNFETNNSATKYISGKEASTLLKVNQDAIPKLINQKKLKGHIETVGKQLFISVEYESLLKLKKHKETYINLPEAVSMLGINRFAIIKLYEGGILKGYEEEIKANVMQIYLNINSILNLLYVFEKKLVQIELDTERKILINFNTCIHSCGCRQISIVELVRTIISGEINAIGITNGTGLNKYLFSKTDIDSVANNGIASKIKSEYSMKEVGYLLKTDDHITKMWADAGYLKVNKINRKKVIVSREDLDFFRKHYITLPEISKRLNQNSKKIANNIKKMGLTILTGPVNNSGGYLFLREEIEEIFLN
jgi:hypothetical protein